MTERRVSGARWLSALILCALLAVLVMSGCGRPSGEELVEARCTRCHTAAIIGVSSKTAHEWFNTVYRMKQMGAEVDEDEVEILVEYLSTHFGP